MNQEYHESGGLLGGKGFYIALMLCVSVIALSAWMIVSGGREDSEPEQLSVTATPALKYEVSDFESLVQTTPVVQPEIPDVQEIFEPVPSQEPVEEVTAPVEQPEVQAVSAVPKSYVWPVIGEVSMEYSMDALVYNETMGDWRTHDGMDIAAQAGEYVRAAAQGTVTDVYEDVLYGTTVVIDHGAGLVSYYANLQAQPVVKQGDEVLAGDVIGAVGETALCESTQTPHLHFAMSLKDESVDPKEYMPVL